MGFYELNRAVIRREAGGKTIWQPRIAAWWSDRRFRGEEMPGKYADVETVDELYDRLQCSNRLYDFTSCIVWQGSLQYPISGEWQDVDEVRKKHILHTPWGDLTQIVRSNTSNEGQVPEKWQVETEEDLRIMIKLEEATEAEYGFNEAAYQSLLEKKKRFGLPAICCPRAGLQHMIVDICGVENTYYLLADCPELVEEYLRLYSKNQEKYFRAIAKSPFEWVNYGDNIHSKVLPPSMFEQYVLPEYEKRADWLGDKIFKFAHWDGTVKELLPYAKSCFLDGIEAITPLPQGDVTLQEIKQALGDDIFLVDGIAAVLFSEVYPVEQLVQQTKDLLEMFEGQLVLGISDELASDGTLDRVELVRDMVEEFNAKRGVSL